MMNIINDVGIVNLISYIIMGFGLFFMLIGIIGLFKFKNFYPRLLITSKIDTVGTMIFMIGIAINFGFSFFTAKILLLLIIILSLNPMMTHFLAKAAFYSNLKPENNQQNKNERL